MENKFAEQSSHIYCVCGNLEDIICGNNLRKVKFNQFLSEYLKNVLGYETVVFFLSTRGMRVFDAASARILIGDNKAGDWEEEDAPEEDEDELIFSNPLPGGEAEEAEEKGKADGEISYQARIDSADFLGLMENLLRDSGHKSAVVFENIGDYIRANEECTMQYDATLHYLLSDSLDDNHNRVIFLAMNKDYEQIYSQVYNNDILRGAFFKEDGNSFRIIEDRFLQFGRPGRDEISNLLEHYRLLGNGRGSFLEYRMSELPALAYLLEAYMEILNRDSLTRLNEDILSMMAASGETAVVFDRQTIQRMYPQVTPVSLPIEKLKGMDYAAEVCRRMGVLERYQLQRKEDLSLYDVHRFTKKMQEGLPEGKRFLVRGIEKSNRTKAAVAMVDFLYYIREITDSRYIMVGKAEYAGLNPYTMERTVRAWAEAAKDTVLIFDDLDSMAERENGAELLNAFHRCLLQELDRNCNMHLILVINTSREGLVFGEHLEAYHIPDKNMLTLSKVSEKQEDILLQRADVQEDR